MAHLFIFKIFGKYKLGAKCCGTAMNNLRLSRAGKPRNKCYREVGMNLLEDLKLLESFRNTKGSTGLLSLRWGSRIQGVWENRHNAKLHLAHLANIPIVTWVRTRQITPTDLAPEDPSGSWTYAQFLIHLIVLSPEVISVGAGGRGGGIIPSSCDNCMSNFHQQEGQVYREIFESLEIY